MRDQLRSTASELEQTRRVLSVSRLSVVLITINRCEMTGLSAGDGHLLYYRHARKT